MAEGEVGGELLEVAFLAAEVEFAQERAAELLHHVDRLVALELVGLLGQRGEGFEDARIELLRLLHRLLLLPRVRTQLRLLFHLVITAS